MPILCMLIRVLTCVFQNVLHINRDRSRWVRICEGLLYMYLRVICQYYPDPDLYKHGLQRSNFVPFITVLKNYCSVLELVSGVDYRRTVMATTDGHVYLS